MFLAFRTWGLPPTFSTTKKGKTMSPIESAAAYTLCALILYAFTGFNWLLGVGGALALSAIGRHLYAKERA